MASSPNLSRKKWSTLKAVLNKKSWFDDYEKHVLEFRKPRRKKLSSISDIAETLYPCLIRRPSIILPEDEERIRKQSQKLKPPRPQHQPEELSDFEDDTDEDNIAVDKLTLSQDLYIRSCRMYNVVPISTFYKQLTGQSIVLKHHTLSNDAFKACAVALIRNESVTQLDLEGDQIGPTGMLYLSDIIYHTDILVKLNLTRNNLGSEGLMLLKEAMEKNLHLLELNLSDNDISDKDCDILRQIIQGDNFLQSLNLSNNNIGNVGAKFLAQGLANSDELKVLNLSWNRISATGASSLSYGLTQNDDLCSLNLSWNALHDGGAHSLAHGLEGNSSLTELDISSNRINQSGLAKLLKGLQMNNTLESLTLADNPIRPVGALLTILATEDLDNMRYIDFGNQPVTEEFEKKISEIRKKKKLVVRCGKIVLSKTKDKGCDNTMYISGDPRLILFEFARMKHINILEMFRSFDIDGSHSITWDEFRQGVKKYQLPIRPGDIEKIIQTVDINMDGEVDFSELIIAQKAHKRRVDQMKAEGDDFFEASDTGKINGQLRQWFADTLSLKPMG